MAVRQFATRFPLVGTMWAMPRDRRQMLPMYLNLLTDEATARYGVVLNWYGNRPGLTVFTPDAFQTLLGAPWLSREARL